MKPKISKLGLILSMIMVWELREDLFSKALYFKDLEKNQKLLKIN